MNCRDIDRVLAGSAPRDSAVERHLESCADCRQLVSTLDSAAVSTPPDTERLRARLLDSLAPVRPLPSTATLAAFFLMVCAAAAIGGALALRIDGWPVLTAVERAVIFSVLAIAVAAASVLSASEMIPAARRVRARTLFLLVIASAESVILLLFRNHSFGAFIPDGIVCLRAGLIVALPVALIAPMIMARGAVLDRVSAGAAIGMVAGLAGLIALELHCPNLRAWHIAVWHAGVVLVSTAFGALVGVASNGSRRVTEPPA